MNGSGFTNPLRHTAFTSRYNGRSLRLTSEIEVFPAFEPSLVKGSPPSGKKYVALYDTGATNSAITPKVVSDLNLPSIGARNVGVGGGLLTTTSHMVNIGLPNKVLFGMIPVAKMVLLGGIDVIIGMDILGLGDFSVTHHNGKTTFSFCCPSRKEIDFTSEINASQGLGRNSLCHCGSGKKFKRCHGV